MLYCNCAAKYGYHLDFTHLHQPFWRRKWQPTPVFLPGDAHGQRSLVGYSSWGHKESDTTEQLTHTHTLSLKGEREKRWTQSFFKDGLTTDCLEDTVLSHYPFLIPLALAKAAVGHRRAGRNYSTFKVRRGGREKIPLRQGKEQWLRLAGAAVKRYPTSKVRETQVRW